MMNSNAKMRSRFAAAALAGLMLAAIPLCAQQDAPPPPQAQDAPSGPPSGGRGGMNPERRLAMMTKVLNLSTDQQAAMRQILADERAKMEAQRSSGQQMSPQDRRAAMMAMRQEQTAKIEAVLTPDQKVKFEEMEAKMRERMQEHRDGSTPPPPPPQ